MAQERKDYKPMKKNLAIALTASALTLGGAAGVGIAQSNVSAAENNTATSSQTARQDHMSSLVDALVKKFNLKKADVQAVFDANREQMHAQHEADAKTRLAQLVKDGKLTQEQADKITAKRAEIQKEREANRSAGTRPSESDMQTKRTELDKWFSDNNIPTEYRHLVMGGGHRGPGGHGGRMGDRDGDGPRNHMSSQGSTSSSTTTTTSN